jgi:hypothetical protein
LLGANSWRKGWEAGKGLLPRQVFQDALPHGETRPDGAQAYYDPQLRLFAEWGVAGHHTSMKVGGLTPTYCLWGGSPCGPNALPPG